MLYNAHTTKETSVNPNDILNLSLFNSGDLNNYAEIPIDDIDYSNIGIKRVSLNEIDNPLLLKGDI